MAKQTKNKQLKRTKSQVSVHHKKLSTKHRKLNTPRLYLTLLAIVVLGLFLNHIWSVHPKHVLGLTTNISPSVLLTETNQQRILFHEPTLTLNQQLMNAAQTKAINMVQLNYWSHYTPSGEPPWTFISNAGYNYQSAGENLAYGFTTAQGLMTGWMNSPPHRKNILDSSYQNVGFGIVNSSNYMGQGPSTLVVAMYGQPQVASSVNKINEATFVNNIPPKQTINRFQLLTGTNSEWEIIGLAAVIGSLITYLIIKHALQWRRALVYSEKLIISHPWLDVFITVVVMGAFLFSRTVGYIG